MFKLFSRSLIKKENFVLKFSKFKSFDPKNMSTLSENKKFKVFVTQPIPDQAKQILETDKIELHINETLPLSRARLLDAVEGCHGIFCTLNEKIDKEIIDQAGLNLKVN